ncbi:probable WRKY transcription factor 4 isoform X2 [Vigna radiata var. radiata]|uniref:Probable WRKY transcription factor 4 isoform X2 n=1 Tax=Vigna radiata var. radiata TaxID=3916 RepID=A0A1S3UPA3_VIGRR|nr:probable WRKY transcription factor 4 isoform X2 [Vigna radiata var. radiata]
MVGGGNGEGAPPSTAAESVFNGGEAVGYSPGPMTLLSNLLGNGDEYKSFSEFLAGAMMDPTPPRFFPDSPSQQQMLAHITSHSNVKIQAEDPYSLTQVSTTISTTAQHLIPQPNDDGYNWRKYGQKHVKGSDFSRSYYKCTHPNCPVKKKLERSLEGHVTAIIYKGEHNHQRKGTLTSTEKNSDKLKEEMSSHSESGTSDSEEVGDNETEMDEKNDEPDPKRRNTEARLQDPASLHRAVAEPRIIVQTTSEVDLLDDGYRWRKYGQKVVKGNPYPRSYYKCTTSGCNVRKHVERASTDPKAVITTYEGKHNHDVPAAKTNSHTLANNSSTQPKIQNAMPDEKMHSFRGNEQRPVASLRLKEEKIT